MKNHVLVVGIAGLGIAAAAALYLDAAPPDCSGGGRLCPKLAEAESGDAKLAAMRMRAQRAGDVSPGALRKAVEKKAAMEGAKSLVPGADGQWGEYGRGGLLSSGLAQTLGAAALPDTNLMIYAGRVDNFAYDPVAMRLFAAVGTGGIWMSQATGNDVRTIGDLWVPVGDRLPSLSNGAVVWTSGGGGTLIAAGGESVMGNFGHTGLGAFWTTDLGTTWHQSEGFPDEAQVYNARADAGNPNIVYIASTKGLFRSIDAGRHFVNVRLPTMPACAGNEDISSPCQYANFVTDVVVKQPGGVENFECSHDGCPVLAAVGWRAGAAPFPDGTPQAPANGLYKSATGEPGSFVKLDIPAVDPVTEQGFAPQERIGRIEMGSAVGPDQDHNYVYALVHDAVLQNGGDYTLDPPLDALGAFPRATLINGAYMSPDFGDTWMRMASTDEIANIPGAYAALIAPGGQSWYNQWIQPDPTRTLPVLGIPTRLVFGLEEIFQNIGSAARVPLNGIAQMGPQDFENIGRYFSATGADQTTHPDQHAGIFIPTGDGGVCLFAGNDGGVARQCISAVEEFDNARWGRGANQGFYTLLPYGLAVAKDGTVWFGLQDNGSGHMDPDGLSYGDFGADGFYAEVDPDNSDISYTESQNGGLRRTTDRGATATTIAPAYTEVNFDNWFSMDPLDAQHLVTGANQIYETTEAQTVTSGTWKRVFTLGKNRETNALRTTTRMDVQGDAVYAAFCGACGWLYDTTVFQNGIATNVGGSKPPKKGTSDGWHHATARGLDNRVILSIDIDPADPKTVYVGLGGYRAVTRPVGSYGDTNPNVGTGNVFKSTDAGETFTDITGDLPDIQVNAVLVRGGQILVGTEIGAFISSDLNGTSWAPLGNGLPATPVTMLRLKPGDPNHLFASTFGRGIWDYKFNGTAAEVAPPQAAGKQGRGLMLGGLAPLSLLVLLVGLGARRWRALA